MPKFKDKLGMGFCPRRAGNRDYQEVQSGDRVESGIAVDSASVGPADQTSLHL